MDYSTKVTRKTPGLWKIKFALTIAGRIQLAKLNRASKDCTKSQHRVLMDILSWAKDSVYGKKHGFGTIKSFEDFQTKVPINRYEDLEPYIKRHTKGEADVLFPGKPRLYGTTSGTTKEPKWIPVTDKYYKEAYSAQSKLWFYSVLRENPHVFDGPEFSIVGKAVEGYAEDGTSYGSLSGQVYRDIPKFLKNVHVLPDSVWDIGDYYSRYYVILRFAMMYHIRLVITGNPSTLVELNNIAQSKFNLLTDDIEAGTLSATLTLDDQVRKDLESHLSPFPERAAELRNLKAKHGDLLPKHYWPTLELINTWRCGNSGLYLQLTEGFYPDDTKIREFRYMATEAAAGIVLKNDQIASIIAGHTLFFEFIKKDDKNTPNPRVYLAHEVEVGEYYYLIVTTSSGIYRYDMNDIVRIEGFYNEFPMFRFIQKGAGVTTLTGEKLYESQFLETIQDVETELKVRTRFHIGFADFSESAYRVFVEFDSNFSESTLSAYADKLDEKLRKANIEYESKRGSNRLRPLIIQALRKDAFEGFKAKCMAKGYRDGQFKLTHLMQDDRRMEMFKELTVGTEIRSSEDR
jgi:hypothetical protein